MSTSIETKLRTAALAFPGLTNLLGGTNPNTFRWYDTQLRQGTAFPAIVVTLVSNPADYVFTGILATSFCRVQFEVWDYDPEDAYQVEQQLGKFLLQFNAYGSPNLPANANFILNQRKLLYADTQPPQYQRITDARIFNNSTI